MPDPLQQMKYKHTPIFEKCHGMYAATDLMQVKSLTEHLA